MKKETNYFIDIDKMKEEGDFSRRSDREVYKDFFETVEDMTFEDFGEFVDVFASTDWGGRYETDNELIEVAQDIWNEYAQSL
jgi:hypothetical protein